MALELARALGRETASAAGAETELVSVTCDRLGRPEAQPFAAQVEIVRRTRTLVFANAQLSDAKGKRVMAATAVYRVLPV